MGRQTKTRQEFRSKKIYFLDVKMSRIRQNFHEECEALINKQINMELYASYVYLSMSYYFARDDVALHGYAKYFKKNSDEERDHAQKFMDYQNKRGGRVVLKEVAKPNNDEWGTKNNDPHFCDFLESDFLAEQVDDIKEKSDMITKLKNCGPGLGVHILDKELE